MIAAGVIAWVPRRARDQVGGSGFRDVEAKAA